MSPSNESAFKPERKECYDPLFLSSVVEKYSRKFSEMVHYAVPLIERGCDPEIGASDGFWFAARELNDIVKELIGYLVDAYTECYNIEWQACDRVDDLTYRLNREKKKKEAKNKEET